MSEITPGSPLFHGSDHRFRDGDIIEPREGIAWATKSRNVAGSVGSYVFRVKHLSQGILEDAVTDVLGFTVITEVGNPHTTGECGRQDCDYSDHNVVTGTDGHEYDNYSLQGNVSR